MNHPLRFLAGALLALSLVACHQPASAPQGKAAQPMQLKIYHVSAQQSPALVRALHSALSGVTLGNIAKDKDNSMRVTEPFPGTVMVLAPSQMQDSIGNAIKALTKASAKAPGTQSLRVHFWVVQAKAGDGADAPALRPLEPALKQIRASLGSSHFVLNEAVSAITNAPDHFDPTAGTSLTTSHGHDFDFNASSTANGNIKLQMDYTDKMRRTIPHLHTQTTIRPGEYVVLAQAPSTDHAASNKNTTLMNLLVVRVDRVNKTAP